MTSWTASFRSVWCGVSERVRVECGGMQGGVQDGWAASGNVDEGSAGGEEEAGRGASCRTRQRTRGRRGGCDKAVRRARAAVRRALLAGGFAAAEFISSSVAVQFKLDARHRAARRDMFSSMWLEGVEQKTAQAACDEAFEQALREAESEIDAADARMRAALGAVDVASRKVRDAVAARGTRRQSRSGDGGPEQQGESTCTGRADVLPLPPCSSGGAGGDRCGVGERGASGSRGSGLQAVRRGGEMAGRVPRRAVLIEGGRGGWLEGSGGAASRPAAWARLRRVRGARGRRLRRCAPGWQQVGQPPGRPPGCHRGVGCPLGRDKLGMGPWLGDGC